MIDFFKRVYRIFRLIFKINWIKTVYLNVKTQKLTDALRFPIIVYGKMKIYSFKGKLLLDGPITTGMIHFGKDLDHNPVSLCPIKLSINGTLRFQGNALISGGSTITVWSGEIELGKNVCIGSGVQLKCVEKITIGDYSRIIALSTIMDTNVHYVKQIDTGKILKSFAPIIIGKNCWINQGSIVSKGTRLPDYSIAARNSYLNKDYFIYGKENLLLAGTPAKKIANNVQRIFCFEKETELNLYFQSHIEAEEKFEDIGLFEEPGDPPALLTL